ncbi:hypothetical protein KHA90_04100 [Flavobacterium psychroterrae]|uniref:Uncharacterized protein n=1 Tax=Flavobacterium psychroterrae TaxID=2133767 RepID=A0ABS5P8K3_9FLAO|nr:hypothetical protein [Flavobacterium psychroterrae]MBS7230198.1 hypothetical protein [Flavobacterium psychroterrae]
MIKTVEEITIVMNNDLLILTNRKNKSYFRYNLKDKQLIFRDSNDNIIQNYSARISINFEVFYLTYEGQTINMSDGSMIAYLSYKDIQELAEKTFYEEGQKRVYDFVNLKFIIEL